MIDWSTSRHMQRENHELEAAGVHRNLSSWLVKLGKEKRTARMRRKLKHMSMGLHSVGLAVPHVCRVLE